MHHRAIIAKNALSNMVRGGSTTLVNLLLPAVLVRHLSRSDYSIWVLILQIAAYSIYLELGFQTAVGRYIAIAVETEDREAGDAVYSTALVALSCAAALALLCLAGVALAAHWLFPEVPATALRPMKMALLIFGCSVALGLPSFAWTGVFIGLQRNELIAIITGGAKLLLGASVALAAVRGASIVELAAIAATINILSYFTLWFMVRATSHFVFRPYLITRATIKEIAGYCYSLMMWNLSMLLINGLDLILVGRFEFTALAPFAIASTLVGTVQGIQLAIFNATMPRAAVLHARCATEALGRFVIRNTQLGTALLILVGMSLLIYAGPILRMWVGAEYVTRGKVYLNVLVIANIIRLVATPYTVVLVASGQQRLVILSPILEGVTNLTASVVFGERYGAIGVAMGTLIGGILGFLGHVLYNLPRTRIEIGVRSREFLTNGLGPIVAVTAPLTALWVYSLNREVPNVYLFMSVFLLAAIVSFRLSTRGDPLEPLRSSAESAD